MMKSLSNPRPSKNTILILIIFLVAVAQSGLALYLPSLPAIQEHFAKQASTIQLTVFYYVIGISASQWFYGPLSDIYGRRKIALGGLSLFILGTVIAIFSMNIHMLLTARGIQGIGMGAVMTINRAILRDIFRGKEYVKNASRLASAFAVSPVIFPLLGGYIQSLLGWQANFIFMLILSVIALFCWYFQFKENHCCQKTFRLTHIVEDYIDVAKSTIFWKNALCGGLIYSGEVIFLTMAPFLIQAQFHLSASSYGKVMLMAIFGFIAGSQYSSYLSEKLKHCELILLGLLFCFLSTIMMLIEAYVLSPHITMIILTLSVYMFGAGLVYPNTSLGAVGHFPEKAGTASAFLSSTQGFISAIGAGLVATLNHNTLDTMAIIFLVIVILSGLLGGYIFYQERNHVLK